MKRTHGLDEREMELAKLLIAEYHTTRDIQAKLKKLFAGTICGGRSFSLLQRQYSRECLYSALYCKIKDSAKSLV